MPPPFQNISERKKGREQIAAHVVARKILLLAGGDVAAPESIAPPQCIATP